jgi:hypothetical protein
MKSYNNNVRATLSFNSPAFLHMMMRIRVCGYPTAGLKEKDFTLHKP